MHHVHGAKEMQSHDAASNNNVPIKVQKGGVCKTHGAQRNRCTASKGVPTKAKEGGVCITHGAKVTVNDAAMRNVSIKSVCWTHCAKVDVKQSKREELYDTHGEETMQLLGL